MLDGCPTAILSDTVATHPSAGVQRKEKCNSPIFFATAKFPYDLFMRFVIGLAPKASRYGFIASAFWI